MSQALIDLDLFDPGGCETPPLPFNPEQIEVIKKVVSGEAFENPISGANSDRDWETLCDIFTPHSH